MTETSAAQALCQSGVIAEANSDALFITYDLSPEADVSRLKHLLAQVPVLTRAMEDTSSQSGAGAELHVTVAVGEQVWDQFDATQRPAELLPFLSSSGISCLRRRPRRICCCISAVTAMISITKWRPGCTPCLPSMLSWWSRSTVSAIWTVGI